LPKCAVLGQIPSGLPHQPDRRDRLPFAGEDAHQRFRHRFIRCILISNTNRILESVVVLGQLIGLINCHAHPTEKLPTYPRLAQLWLVGAVSAIRMPISGRFAITSQLGFHILPVPNMIGRIKRWRMSDVDRSYVFPANPLAPLAKPWPSPHSSTGSPVGS
jgi:hypothetical protein